MKFTKKYIKIGEGRILTKFAILPITCKLQGKLDKETRWLCFVKIRQTYLGGEWTNSWWIDE